MPLWPRSIPHIVILSNYNVGGLARARLQNGVTTEDGQEPGYYMDGVCPPLELARQHCTLEQKPYLATNAGLIRYNTGYRRRLASRFRRVRRAAQ